MFNIFVNFKDTKKKYLILESSLDNESFFDALYMSFINYRKSKTIFMSSLNSHVYIDTLYIFWKSTFRFIYMLANFRHSTGALKNGEYLYSMYLKYNIEDILVQRSCKQREAVNIVCYRNNIFLRQTTR